MYDEGGDKLDKSGRKQIFIDWGLAFKYNQGDMSMPLHKHKHAFINLSSLDFPAKEAKSLYSNPAFDFPSAI